MVWLGGTTNKNSCVWLGTHAFRWQFDFDCTWWLNSLTVSKSDACTRCFAEHLALHTNHLRNMSDALFAVFNTWKHEDCRGRCWVQMRRILFEISDRTETNYPLCHKFVQLAERANLLSAGIKRRGWIGLFKVVSCGITTLPTDQTNIFFATEKAWTTRIWQRCCRLTRVLPTQLFKKNPTLYIISWSDRHLNKHFWEHSYLHLSDKLCR